MKDMLCFLNELVFVDKLDNNYLEKMLEVKRMMVGEFEHYKIPKKLHGLNIFDEIQLSSLTNDSDYCLERTDSLRSNILYLISFEHLVDTNNRQVDE